MRKEVGRGGRGKEAGAQQTLLCLPLLSCCLNHCPSMGLAVHPTTP